MWLEDNIEFLVGKKMFCIVTIYDSTELVSGEKVEVERRVQKGTE